MKFLKNYDKFSINYKKSFESKINEETTPNDSTDKNVKVIRVINSKERIIESKIFKYPKEGSKLSERGPELVNQAVMKNGENPDSLNINIDSEKLEYAWRMIAKDVDGALKATKIEKDGKVVAFNIKKTDDNKVTFDFTFENKDSTQNTDPSGKTTKNILAGTITPSDLIVELVEVPQVQAVIGKNQANISLNTNVDKVKYANDKQQLIEAGYVLNSKGTYNLINNATYRWVTYDTKNNAKVIEYFHNNPDSRFDVLDLYRKFGINPNKPHDALGTPNWDLPIK